jgi:hypothetical protein
MIIDSLTFGQLKLLENDPEFATFLSRKLITTYDEFIAALYENIDICIDELQSSAELLRKDGEDRLTLSIRSWLKAKGYDVTHDEKHRGHCDLLVKHNSFKWIGEAKIHSSYEYLWKGFNQLSTRYSTGDTNQKAGGMIIYIKNVKNAKSVMKNWKKHLDEKKLDGYSTTSCPKRDLVFYSAHIHDVSGLSFKVRHMPVLLYFNPQDN